MVPDGWELKGFGEIANIANGQVDPRVEPYCSLPHVGPENVISDSGRVVGVKSCGELDLISGKYQFDEYAIVYSKIRPNLNKVCIPGFSGLCSADMYPLWPKDGIDARFLLQLMLGPEFVGRTTAVSMRTGMPKINRSDLAAIPVKLPPLAEQEKVAEILSTWDKAIVVTEKLLKKSQHQKKALMQQLLTSKKRLGGFQMPWEKHRLEQLFSRVTTMNTEANTNVVTISAQHGLIRQEEFFSKAVASETLDNYFLIKKGQFAYNKSYSNGYPMGAIKRLNNYEKGVVTTLYICFEVNDEAKCNPEFFEHYFESGLLNKGLSKVANEGGRAHGLLNVKPSDFFGLNVFVPEISEQKAIAAVITSADQEIQSLQNGLACLKDEKKALMQQLLTGRRRVKIDETLQESPC
ncbi:restriction endonuclease subunit S [Serpens gallinarum]|uniref:Restriction endonuclease subunit S n=1 Tax=Serpens gallinarum TaxID=2763075 RepID=A0ABR8TMD3_9PSED|nr:restriction endonuclease subunit S [Serpens gallinarum]MBD7976804.1 restriction endonuclease subunit S [Serpens gallinarum]